jgi:hypothetical protein
MRSKPALALPRASRYGEIAPTSSRSLRSTPVAALVLVALAVATVAPKTSSPISLAATGFTSFCRKHFLDATKRAKQLGYRKTIRKIL